MSGCSTRRVARGVVFTWLESPQMMKCRKKERKKGNGCEGCRVTHLHSRTPAAIGSEKKAKVLDRISRFASLRKYEKYEEKKQVDERHARVS